MTRSRFDPEKRRMMIIDIARQKGRVLVEDLASDFSASHETIRRDLNHLAAAGVLRKFHGGACLPSLTDENPFSVRMAEQTSGKRAIARAAAALFNDGDTLFVDTGTTTLFFAEELAELEGLSIVTNSTAIAAALAGRRSNNIILLGGIYRPDAGQTIGEATIEQISEFRAAHAVLTIGALHAKDGIMDFSMGEAQVARAMISQADRLTIVADHSKIGRSAFVRVCQIDTIDRLVTDQRPDAETMDALLAANVEVIIAG